MASDENYLAALKRERASYEQAGKADRIPAVDAEIARVQAELGGAVSDPTPVVDAADPPVDAEAPAVKRAQTRKRG